MTTLTKLFFPLLAMVIIVPVSCRNGKQPVSVLPDDFKYFVDQFEDMRVLKYKVPGFDSLSLKQKKFIYYLSEAALWGRDILWDQNFKYNLPVRRTLETILKTYTGDKESDAYKSFLVYAKRVFFANGIHHHYSNDKLKPGISKDFFAELIKGSGQTGLPLEKGESVDQFISRISPIIFDDKLYPRKIEQKEGTDMVAESATNFYEGVTQKEVEKYYAGQMTPGDPHPVSLGLNSKVLKINGKITEEVYKSGGKYGSAIDKIILNLEKAIPFAESETQKKEIGQLIEYYKTGDLKKWDEYNIT